MTPYRLEMQAKLAIGEAKNLYAYWNSNLADVLCQEDNCVLNLASKEYSICVSRHLPPNIRMVTCIFAERKGEELIEKGTMCKMARGEMVRFLAEHQADRVEDAKEFDGLNYHYSQKESKEK